MVSLDIIAQVGLTIFSITAIILVARKNRWGFVSGMISQPFWLITSYVNQQWGIFFTSIVFTFSWAYGIHEWFFKDKKKRK